MSDLMIEIEDLFVRRSGRPVLEIDQLKIEKGKVLALVGPNGAGKSTLLLVLARLLKPERGKILFAGQQLDRIKPLDYRRHIGLVMQDALMLDMSVRQNIAIGLHFRNLPGHEIASRVEEWLERLNITHLKNRPAARLSGGEAQRVALARAFALQPELLLLDEPFGALDKQTRPALIHDLKILLPTMQTTTLFSTHDDREVNALADSKIELTDGRIDSRGST
jgi:tungstate transport system ATP-binding protein